jgi:hypothetical protein
MNRPKIVGQDEWLVAGIETEPQMATGNHRMKGWWSWPVVAVLGFGMMLLGYSIRPALYPAAPWAHGLIILGPEGSAEQSPPAPLIATRLRLLPGSEWIEVLLNALGQATPAQASRLNAQLRPKLIRLPPDAAGIGAEMLQAGRLPTAGLDEILAGAQAASSDRISVAGRTLEVVGVLKPDAVVFADCYLIPPSASENALFADGDAAVQPATLVRLSAEQVRDRQVQKRLEAAYPSARYTRVMSQARLDRRGDEYGSLTPKYLRVRGQKGPHRVRLLVNK